MFKPLLKLVGIHVHDWNPYGDSYTEHYEQQVPIVEERVVGYDEFEEEDIIEEVPTGQYTTERWTKDFQKRTCSSCGKEERRRVR